MIKKIYLFTLLYLLVFIFFFAVYVSIFTLQAAIIINPNFQTSSNNIQVEKVISMACMPDDSNYHNVTYILPAEYILSIRKGGTLLCVCVCVCGAVLGILLESMQVSHTTSTRT